MAVPAARSGFRDCLTPEQTELLAQLWRVFFASCAVETDESPSEPAPTLPALSQPQEAAHQGLHPRQHSIPADDHAKHQLQRLEEASEMRAFLQLYGGAQLRQIFYTAIVRGDHPDAVMLRFLRSRKWEVQAAANQIGSVARFRVEAKLDALMRGGEPQLARTKGASSLMHKGVCYIWGATPRGEPIYWIEVARHLSANQTQHELHQLVLYYQEWLSLLMVPPVERKLIVFNLTGFGLRNMDWWCIFAIVKTIERYYPETVSHFLVWNPPWIFKPIWYILKPLLDPVVRDKVVITSDMAEMSKYVPLHRIPAETFQGGQSPWKYTWPGAPKPEDMPAPDRLQEQQKTDDFFAAVQGFEDAMRTWLLARDRARAQHGKEEHDPSQHITAVSTAFAQLHKNAPRQALEPEMMDRTHSLSNPGSGPGSLEIHAAPRAQSLFSHTNPAAAPRVDPSVDPIVQGAKSACEQAAKRMRLHWLELLPHLVGGNMWQTWGVTKLDGSVRWTYPLPPGWDAKSAETEKEERASLASVPLPGGSVMELTRTEKEEVQVLGGSSAVPALIAEMDTVEQWRSRRRPWTECERAPTRFRTVAPALKDAAPWQRQEPVPNDSAQDSLHVSSEDEEEEEGTRTGPAPTPGARPHTPLTQGLSPAPAPHPDPAAHESGSELPPHATSVSSEVRANTRPIQVISFQPLPHPAAAEHDEATDPEAEGLDLQALSLVP